MSVSGLYTKLMVHDLLSKFFTQHFAVCCASVHVVLHETHYGTHNMLKTLMSYSLGSNVSNCVVCYYARLSQ